MNYLFLIALIFLVVIISNRLADFGQKSSSERVLQKQYGKPCLVKAGHLVRSKAEQQIANYLYDHNISYVYEAKIHGFRPDFYLPEYKLVIEYFGLATINSQTGYQYRKKMRNKLVVYRQHGQKIVSIYPNELEDSSYQSKIQVAIGQEPEIS